MTPLQNSTVLVAGGINGTATLASTEIYDPTTVRPGKAGQEGVSKR
jgi:hypothetical protein